MSKARLSSGRKVQRSSGVAEDLKVHSAWPFVDSFQRSGSRVVSVTTL